MNRIIGNISLHPKVIELTRLGYDGTLRYKSIDTPVPVAMMSRTGDGVSPWSTFHDNAYSTRIAASRFGTEGQALVAISSVH